MAARTPVATAGLPASLTPFLGRREEIAQLRALLERGRLVTIVGPGGAGKTRLALHLAEHSHDRFADGVCLVPLVSVGSPDELVAAMADALHLALHEHPSPMVQLVNLVRDRHLLCVLDNFEHLTDCAVLLAELLAQAPRLHILVSSRERLNVYGEAALELGGMSWDAGAGDCQTVAHSDAALLFRHSAERAGGQLDMRADTLAQVVRICRFLDGLPLAIELAASWTKLLPCRDIAERVEADIGFLSTSWRGLPPRHRSLRAVCEHSWRLLDEGERQVAQRLSVFCGPIELGAAEDVAGATIEVLASLMDKSILSREPGGRVAMHAVLRQHAAAMLARSPAEASRVRARHAARVAAFVRARETAMTCPEDTQVLSEVATELENIRAAWRWATGSDAVDVLDACVEGVFRFHDMRSQYRAGEALFAEAAARWTGQAPGQRAQRVLGRLLARQGLLRHRLGDTGQAESLLEDALARVRAAGDAQEAGFCLTGLARVLLSRGAYAQARERLQEARRALDGAGPDAGSPVRRAVETEVLRTLGNLEFVVGNYAMARDCYQRCVHRCRELGDRRTEVLALSHLGATAYVLGDFDQAYANHHECLGFFRQANDQHGQSRIMSQMAHAFCYQGDYERAAAWAEQAIEVARAASTVQGLGVAMGIHGTILDRVGDYPAAAARLEEGVGILDEIGDRLFGLWFLVVRSLAQHHLGDHEAARRHAARAVQVGDMMAARSVGGNAANVLGHALAALGRPAEAAEAYQRARAAGEAIEQRAIAVEAHAGLARLALARGATAEARAHLPHLRVDPDSRDLGGALEPFRIHWTCYQVLRAAGAADARAVLLAAHARLRAQVESITSEHLRACILSIPVHRDIIQASEREAGRAATASEPRAELVEHLSAREREVLQLVASGLSNQDIARRLFISVNTVKRHLSNVFGKLSVRSRTQALARARQLGLLPPVSPASD